MEGEHIVESGATKEAPSARLTGRDALKAHLTLGAGLVLCVAAFWFEIRRAESGNELSWAYVFEWPLLAIFAVYMWWKVLHPGDAPKGKRSHKRQTLAPEFDGMLVAWQEHQRELEESKVAEAQADAARNDRDGI